MKYSIIDMGSNSIRLMLCQIEDRQLKEVSKHLEMTRLGNGVDTLKMLSEESMSSTIEAVRKYETFSTQGGYELIGAFATSAVRDSVNGETFVAKVKHCTGVEVTILSGQEEATLGYLGVLAGLPEQWRQEPFVIVDIGGGSTEVIIAKNGLPIWQHSFDMGAVRMTGKHLKHEIPTIDEVDALRSDIDQLVSPFKHELALERPIRMIGIGGTATTFGAMAIEMDKYDRSLIHNAFTTANQLDDLLKNLSRKTLDERKRIVGLQPKRADIIYAGGIVLQYLLQCFDLDGFYSSDYDNLEGILVQKKLL